MATQPLEQTAIEAPEVIFACEGQAYMGFVDRRRGEGHLLGNHEIPTIFVLDGDFDWIFRQSDFMLLQIKTPDGKAKPTTLGQLRKEMNPSNENRIFSRYLDYQVYLKAEGKLPYLSPHPYLKPRLRA